MMDYKTLYDEVVRIKPLHEDAQTPTRAHTHDAGLDLYAYEPATVGPGCIVKIPTGIAVGIPEGQVGDVRPRSGLASRGVTVANSPGTIDAGYTGELIVMLHNQGRDILHVHKGDRIAQLVTLHINTQPPVVVDTLNPGERGEAGFGSTGA